MRKLILLCAVLCSMVFAFSTAPAHATNLRSWVSSSGSDSNACTLSAPCLTFEHAIGQTDFYGEIDCLTGGDFGTLAINQPITIDCGATQVGGIGLTLQNATALSVNTTGTVVLRNLNINGFEFGGTNGLTIANGAVIMQHCIIHGLSSGITVSPNNGRGLLDISDTAIYGIFGNAIIVTPPSGAIASVVLNRVEITQNLGGIVFEGAGTVAGTLRQSVVSENTQQGISARSAGGVYFTIEESSIIDNLTDGIESSAADVNLEVGASTVGGNGTGVSASAGSIFTFGNNQISANGTNGSFTPGGPGLQ